MKLKKVEPWIRTLLFLAAAFSILAVVLIIVFVFKEGLPFLRKWGLTTFIFGENWSPTRGNFGIFPMLLGSIYLTLGAILIGLPLGVGCAIFFAEFAPAKITSWVRPAVEVLAAIPSVIYGFLGLLVLVPWLRQLYGGTGFSLLAGSLVLGIMILPTVMTVSEDAIRAVPLSYKEGSLALGATRWQTISKITLPAAQSGIVASVVLGMGRALGETMAVIMITGNVAQVPTSLLSPLRTLTGNIALEMGYAAGQHQQALFATGVILFILIFVLTSLANLVRWKGATH